MKIEEIVKQRVEENQELFNESEKESMRNNYSIFSKIYLLGMFDGINIKIKKI